MTVKTVEELADPDMSARRLRSLWRRAAYLTPKWLSDWFRTDLLNLALWTPVAIGVGASLYFGLGSEPPAMIGVLALTGFFAVWWLVRRSNPAGTMILALVLACFGFVAADLRTASVAEPILQEDLGIRNIRGRIISIEETRNFQRFIIALDFIDGVSQKDLPARARISWRGEPAALKPGARVSFRAGLRPPPQKAAPGSYDFSRKLYFEKIGATGFAVSPPELQPDTERSLWRAVAIRIETTRSNLFHRITKAAPDAGGAIVAAIVTGKREGISQTSDDALRDAGLAHLLAISGLHMGLATGLVFFFVRGLLSIAPQVALRYPIKKWAASAALLSGFLYLLISGSGWSARRAFITTGIMFAAILVDRRALSLRNVAIAATIIILTTPEAVFQAGFQMSFAAVTALVAGYEWASRKRNPSFDTSLGAGMKRYGIGLAATDMIAATATAPFALYHFNRVAIYSLPANILAMPLMAFWIMPFAILGFFLMPLGLDEWAWRISALGVSQILLIGETVSSWPGSVSYTPQWPILALLVMTLGGLWLCLLRSPLRLAGFLAIPLAMVIVNMARPPDIFIASSGLNAGVVDKGGDGQILVFSNRRDRFSVSVWAEMAGIPRHSKPVSLPEMADCDRSGCIRNINGQMVSFLSDPLALTEDCRRADLVIAFFPASGREWSRCDAVLIDRQSIWRRGAHSVWLGSDGEVRMRTVSGEGAGRPWRPKSSR